MTQHSRLSPSDAERWFNCPGSIAKTEHMAREASEFSAEGTVAHQIRSDALELGFDAHDFVGQTVVADGFSFTVTAEMADHIQPGIDWIREQAGVLYVEKRVKLDRWLPGQAGTLDAGILQPERIIIDDLKYGAGVPVDPVRNKQQMLYAAGFIDNFCPDMPAETPVLIVIDQPRAGGMKFWETTVQEIIDFMDLARQAMQATLAENPPLRAGPKQCKFCQAKHIRLNEHNEWSGGCAEYDRFNAELIGQKFVDFDSADAPLTLEPSLTPERRSAILQHRSMIEEWLEKLHTEAMRDALAGLPVPGLKVVQGRRGARRWADENAIEGVLARILGEDRFTKKLISPAEAERRLPKDLREEVLTQHTTQDTGKPVLVPESDKRPALTAVADKFNDLDG